jgi:hypothetical protein
MDRINPSIISPAIQAMRAYAKTPTTAGVTPTRATHATTPTTSTRPVQRTEPIGKIAPAAARPASNASKLVAAKVDPINLATDVTPIAGPRPMMTSAGTYSIHPSAVDRNAAATGVRVGRSLDIRG